MSSLRLCDADDCYQSENDCGVYHIDKETEDFLRKHCSYWMKSSYDDICEDCIDNINTDYPNFFIFDEYDRLTISQGYITNPELLI